MFLGRHQNSRQRFSNPTILLSQRKILLALALDMLALRSHIHSGEHNDNCYKLCRHEALRPESRKTETRENILPCVFWVHQ